MGTQQQQQQSVSPVDDFFGGGAPSVPIPTRVLLSSQNPQSKGLQVKAAYRRSNGIVYMDFLFENSSQTTLNNFAIKFNNNYVGVQPDAPLKVSSINPGGSSIFSLPLRHSHDEKECPTTNIGVVQMALKTDLGVLYFQDNIEPYHFFEETGRLDRKEFLEAWKRISTELPKDAANRTAKGVEDVKNRFSPYNIFYVASRTVPQRGDVVYFSLKYKSYVFLLEVTLNNQSCTAIVKGDNTTFASTALNSIVNLLKL